jgi:hypothetical protein
MNPLSHTRCREDIIREEISPESEAHLETCPSCSRFRTRFDRVLQLAPSLFIPPMPRDLPERILVRVRGPFPASEADVSVGPRPRRPILERRRLLPKVAGGLAILVLALVLVPLLSGPSPQSVLQSAASQTAAQRRASLDVTGTVQGETGGTGEEEAGGSPTDQDLLVALEASGGTAFGDRMQLTGSLEVQENSAGVVIAEGRFNQLVAGGETYVLAEGGYRQATGPPPLGQILQSSDSPLKVLRTGAKGEVQDLGEEQLEGEPVHHYRFQVPPTVFQSPLPATEASDWTTDVWVGTGDGLLRRFQATAEGQSTDPIPIDWRTSLGVDLSDFGGAVFDTRLRGAVSAGNDLILPLSPGEDLTRYSGRPVRGRRVMVQAVVGDEGIWIGSSRTDRVFGLLQLQGESPPQIRPGDLITFEGRMRANPSNPSPAFGISQEEGVRQLVMQGQHVAITEVRVH